MLKDNVLLLLLAFNLAACGGSYAPSEGSSSTSGSGPSSSSSSSSSSGGVPICPSFEPCKILPLGDSITEGLGYPGGYRVELFRLATADEKSITFLGNSQNGPNDVEGKAFPKDHEGHTGWTIEQIDGIVPAPALNGSPHIILLHIGTNDIAFSASGAESRLENLVDDILDHSPQALLVVSSVIPLPFAAAAVGSYNQRVSQLVQERSDVGFNIIHVDQFDGFPSAELDDGVHPSQAGYERMGRKWYNAIKGYLN